ncbi:MAG: YbhB/YbcL family Raf kinase inhibitor-like protein [Anaerolineales bacterium]
MRTIAGLAAVLLLVACATETAAPTPEPTAAITAVPTQGEISATEPTDSQTTEVPMSFELSSEAFGQGATIPVTYSCDGENISPPLAWTDPPDGTQGFAMIFDDPDAPAGTWVHWVLFNLPADARSLPEAVAPDPMLPDGTIHGSNSWNSIGYGGPCPPGGEHRYFFKFYALDRVLDLEAGANKEQVLEAMEDHILAQTELMGTYSR